VGTGRVSTAGLPADPGGVAGINPALAAAVTPARPRPRDLNREAVFDQFGYV